MVATKKMEIYKAPPFLIVHLKRFSHQRGMFGSRKIGEMVEFPTEGFDMSRYVIHSDGKAIYDLYAVSNHFGGLGGGHYTAFAKNPVFGKWYEFDDSHVSRSDANSAVTSSAYVLFYKKRQ